MMDHNTADLLKRHAKVSRRLWNAMLTVLSLFAVTLLLMEVNDKYFLISTEGDIPVPVSVGFPFLTFSVVLIGAYLILSMYLQLLLDKKCETETQLSQKAITQFEQQLEMVPPNFSGSFVDVIKSSIYYYLLPFGLTCLSIKLSVIPWAGEAVGSLASAMFFSHAAVDVRRRSGQDHYRWQILRHLRGRSILLFGFGCVYLVFVWVLGSRPYDLNGVDLSGSYLRYAYLRGALLSNANLSNTDLSFADLRGALIHGSRLDGADLFSADVSNASLIGSTISNSRLTLIRAEKANFRSADLSNATLWSSNLDSCRFDYVNATDANIRIAGAFISLRGMNVSGASLELDLSKSSLSEMTGNSVSLTGSKLDSCYFQYVWLNESILRDCDLVRSSGSWLKMDSCDLRRCNFESNQLIGSRFERCTMKGVTFRNSDLSSARFRSIKFDIDSAREPILKASISFGGSDLTKAALKLLDLSQADFSGTTLACTMFDSSLVKGANLDDAEFDCRSFLYAKTWPSTCDIASIPSSEYKEYYLDCQN